MQNVKQKTRKARDGYHQKWTPKMRYPDRETLAGSAGVFVCHGVLRSTRSELTITKHFFTHVRFVKSCATRGENTENRHDKIEKDPREIIKYKLT